MSMQNISAQTRGAVYGWLESPQEERPSRMDFRKELHLSAPRFRSICEDWRKSQEKNGVETREVRKIKSIMDDMLTPQDTKIIVEHRGVEVEDEEEGEDELKQVLKNLYRLSKKNSNAAKVWLQATGNLVEKTEVKIGLSADEIARRNIEADRRIRVGYRVEGVPEKPTLLPDQVREDK